MLKKTIKIRRVGNSLGVIIPQKTLDQWGLKEGDTLTIDSTGIRPFTPRNDHESLDELRRSISMEILCTFGMQQIREKSIHNLMRWKSNGSWGEPYEEWLGIMQRGDDDELRYMMVSRDDHPVQMRQSSPFVGLLPQERVMELKKRVYS